MTRVTRSVLLGLLLFFAVPGPLTAQEKTNLPVSPYPVDVDGDRVSSLGDRMAFQLWVDGGGDELEAIKAARLLSGSDGPVLDVSQYLRDLVGQASQTAAAWAALESGGGVAGAQAQGDGVINSSSTILDTGDVSAFPIVESIRLWKGSQGAPPNQGNQGQVTWKDAAYNDSSWIPVDKTPIGYPNQPFRLDDPSSPPVMQGNYSTFYVRIQFRLPSTAANGFDPDIHDTWEADLGVDDGFVASLNGTEVRRTANVGGSFFDLADLLPDATTGNSHTAVTTRLSAYADILLSAPLPFGTRLDVGTSSILAVHVVNATLDDSDCVFAPKMLVRKRGPFISRASAPQTPTSANNIPTELEVVVRTDADVSVRYTVNGGPEISTNEVFRETEFNDRRGTVARIKVPGSFTV
ncbi:MAG: hypothetical protein HY721_25245, partial [Planctomycetes bacterium]|nr:hypothetical protein [Planctomycetota bacterium]